MTNHKGRIIAATELRIGDVLMPPTVRTDSTISHVQKFRSEMFISLANGNTVEIPHAAKVRAHRSTRNVNHDEPFVVFSNGF